MEEENCVTMDQIIEQPSGAELEAITPSLTTKEGDNSSSPIESELPKEPDTLDKTLASSCNVCSQPAALARKKTDRTSLSCSECKSLVHFPCSRLPGYELYNYIHTKKRYTCEICSDTPPNFLTDLIKEDILNVHKTIAAQESQEIEAVDRFERLESKLDGMGECLEKYNLSLVADKISTMYQQMDKVNKQFSDNINSLNKTKVAFEKLTSKHQESVPNAVAERNALVDEKEEQLKAMRAAETLLIESIGEKDKIIKTFAAEKKQHIDRIDQLHNENQRLSSNINRLEKIEEEKIRFQNDAEKSNTEVTRLTETIESLQTGRRERESELEFTCQGLRTQLDSKQKTLDDLLTQFTGLEKTITKWSDGNRTQKQRTAKQTNGSEKHDDNEQQDPPQPQPKVLLYHDSLCKPINQTIMVREKVDVEKVWSPTLLETNTAIDKITDTPDCIVIQALTREVCKKDPAEYVNDVVETVEKALTKAKKVVISLIVDREDKPLARNRVKAVNGLLQVRYMDISNIVICEHENLRDPRNRKHDKLHLNEMGTAKLATNLKYKIAEALGIEVVKKRENNGTRRNNRRNHSRYAREKQNDNKYNNQGYRDHRYNTYDDYDSYNDQGYRDVRYNMYDEFD